MSVFQYNSPKVKELPEEFVSEMLGILDDYMNDIIETSSKSRNAVTEHQKEMYQEHLSTVQKEYKTIKSFLDKLGLHACYSIPGYRGVHIFPTELDCEMWDIWCWQSRE
jgi:hypothetical protein